MKNRTERWQRSKELSKSQRVQGHDSAAQMGYKNPTLTEILAELHLVTGTLPEKSFMSLARELAAYGFEDQEVMNAVVIESQDQGQKSEPKIVPRIRCWDRERVRLVQISPDVVYANLIGEYPGWEKFIEHLRTTSEAVANALKVPVQITRVDLTTIDKWKVGLAGFTIGQYLNCNGPFIPNWYSEVSVSSDLKLGQGFHHKDGFNKKINVMVRISDDSVQFQIRATFGVTDQQMDFDALMDRLHNEAVQCFESLITDKVRNEVMGGKQ